MGLIKKVLAFLLFFFDVYLSDPNKNSVALKSIMDKVFVACSEFAEKRRCLVLLVGFSGSGKSTFSKSAEAVKYFKIDTKLIHDELNANFTFLQGEDVVNSVNYWRRQFLARLIKSRLLLRAMSEGLAILDDSCNLSKRDRSSKVWVAVDNGYSVDIIHVVCEENDLIARLKERDKLLEVQGKKPVWLDLHYNVQLPRYVKPTSDEVDGKIYIHNTSAVKV